MAFGEAPKAGGRPPRPNDHATNLDVGFGLFPGYLNLTAKSRFDLDGAQGLPGDRIPGQFLEEAGRPGRPATFRVTSGLHRLTGGYRRYGSCCATNPEPARLPPFRELVYLEILQNQAVTETVPESCPRVVSSVPT
jgi:hypothetical protein